MTGFTPNPDFEAQLKRQLRPKLDALNAELSAAISNRGAKSDEELVDELCAITERHSFAPDRAGMQKLIDEARGA